jgi:hypothetical protein
MPFGPRARHEASAASGVAGESRGPSGRAQRGRDWAELFFGDVMMPFWTLLDPLGSSGWPFGPSARRWRAYGRGSYPLEHALLDPSGPFWTLLDPSGPFWTLRDLRTGRSALPPADGGLMAAVLTLWRCRGGCLDPCRPLADPLEIPC